MNFERNIDPHEAIGIGMREFAIQRVGLLAKRANLTIFEENPNSNNPEIIATWRASKLGDYMNLIEKKEKYSISYDFGLFNYGNASLQEVTDMLIKDGVLK